MLPRLSRVALQNKSIVGGIRFYDTTTKAKDIPITHELHGIIKWRRPERLPFWDPRKSCDLKPLAPVDPTWLKLEYQPFQDVIEALPKEHQKLFTVDFGGRKDGIKVIYDQTFRRVRRHKYDGIVEQSIEHKVAWMTVKIRNLRDLITSNEIHRRNGVLRKTVKELVEKRKKWLNRLRHHDYRRFEWLLETLSILFQPTSAKFAKIYRKESITMLTDLMCQDIIAKKMKAYRDELQELKIPFLEEKLIILREIRSDEESMNLASSVTEEIEKTEKLLETLQRTQLEIKPLKEELIDNEVVFS